MEEKKKQFNIYLPPDLIKEIKFLCVEKEMNLSSLTEEMFRNWIKENKKTEENNKKK